MKTLWRCVNWSSIEIHPLFQEDEWKCQNRPEEPSETAMVTSYYEAPTCSPWLLFLHSVTLTSMPAQWTPPSSWNTFHTSLRTRMSCWWKTWVWKSAREHTYWWWETPALARRPCWGSSTGSGKQTVVRESTEAEVWFIHIVVASQHHLVLRFGPDDHMFRAQRNPLPATETLPDRWNAAWTGHCCSFYVVYANGEFLLFFPEIYQKLEGNVRWMRMNSNSLVQQVIYPLKDIYPDSGSLSHLLTVNIPTCILDIKQKHTRKQIACLLVSSMSCI